MRFSIVEIVPRPDDDMFSLPPASQLPYGEKKNVFLCCDYYYIFVCPICPIRAPHFYQPMAGPIVSLTEISLGWDY